MTQQRIHRFRWPLLILILAVGFSVRVWGLDAAPFRGDEAFSASYWAGLPFTQSISAIATIEPHPPLTYAAFRAWGLLVGIDSELTLRMMPTLSSVVGIALIYAAATALFNPAVGLLAALFIALNPYEVWHARDFRNYATWSTLSLLTMYLGWRALRTLRPRALFAYGVCALGVSLFFYFELLFVASIGLFGLIVLQGAWRLRWMMIHAGVGAAVVSVFVLLQGGLFSSGGYGGNTALFNVEALLLIFPGALIVGDAAPLELIHSSTVLVWLGVGLSIAALAAWPRQRWWLACLIVLPLAALSVVSVVVAVFMPRYVLPVVAPLLVLVSGGIVMLWRRGSYRRLIGTGLLAAWISLCLVGVVQLHQSIDYGKSPDWTAIRDFLRTHASPDDLVIQTTVDAAFGFYVDPILATAAIPASPQQTDAQIAQVMAQLDAQYFTIWLFEHSLYDWPNRRAAREWLDANRIKVDERRVMGAPLVRYLPREVQAFELPDALELPTTSGAMLRGYRVERRGDDVEIWLYWSDAPDAPLAVSVQLLGEWNPAQNNPIWAQSDQRLQPSPDLQRDLHILSLQDVPADTYALIVKLYHPETGEVHEINGAELFELAILDIE
jgi:4-amino-4-deoxy-L-arabinose transferase-like glycosyltransferase